MDGDACISTGSGALTGSTVRDSLSTEPLSTDPLSTDPLSKVSLSIDPLSTPTPTSSRRTVQARRFAWMERLRLAGHFSRDRMRERRPDLYQRYLGRFETASAGNSAGCGGCDAGYDGSAELPIFHRRTEREPAAKPKLSEVLFRVWDAEVERGQRGVARKTSRERKQRREGGKKRISGERKGEGKEGERAKVVGDVPVPVSSSHPFGALPSSDTPNTNDDSPKSVGETQIDNESDNESDDQSGNDSEASAYAASSESSECEGTEAEALARLTVRMQRDLLLGRDVSEVVLSIVKL